MGNFLQTLEQFKTIETWHFNVKGDQTEHLRLSQSQGCLGIQSPLCFATGSRQ